MFSKVIRGSFYSGLYSLGASVISLALGLGVTILTARLLGPEGKGSYDLVLASMSLLAILLGWSLPSGITYVISSQPTAISALMKILLVLASVQGVLGIGLLSLLTQINYSQWLLPTKLDNTVLIPIIGLSLVFTALNSYWRAILVGYQEIIQANKFDLSSKIIYPLLLLISAIILYKIGYNISPILCLSLYVFALVLPILIFFRSLYPYLSRTTSSSHIREIISYSTPCYFGNFLQFLNYRLDIFFVANYSHNIADVGFYNLAASLAQLIWLIPNNAATIIFPKVAGAKGINDENSKIITALTARLVFSISLLIAFLMALFFPLLVPVIFGNSFQGTVPPLLWLLPGVISLSGTKILAAYINGIGKPEINLFLAFISIIVTIILDILLIPSLGIVGAAIASSSSYIATTIGTILFFSHCLGFSWKNLIILDIEDVRVLLLKFSAMKQQVKEKTVK
jgi:O-antigen/teichoic acid export membrane protein